MDDRSIKGKSKSQSMNFKPMGCEQRWSGVDEMIKAKQWNQIRGNSP